MAFSSDFQPTDFSHIHLPVIKIQPFNKCFMNCCSSIDYRERG